MEETKGRTNRSVNRRAFLKKGVMAGGAATIGAGLIGDSTLAFAQGSEANVTKGDVAILRFLNAV